MTVMINVLDRDVHALGMGCWPIGGAMYSGDTPMGYTGATDAEAIRTIHAALDCGVTLFDTAAAYGAGHSERLLGQALAKHPDAMVVTKIGYGIDETSRQLTGEETSRRAVSDAVDQALIRLNRPCIDAVLLHVNSLAVDRADAVFDTLDQARQDGKIRAYGWSTDFTDNVRAVSDRDGFAVVEHAMNVFVDAPRIRGAIAEAGCIALLRSPLAMGLLSGKYDTGAVMPVDDVRANALLEWAEYFVNGRPNPDFLRRLDAVRELLTTGGRTLVQGALGWLWAKGPQNIPIPGAKSAEQITGIAGALDHGPLPTAVMEEIATLLPRDPAAPDQER